MIMALKGVIGIFEYVNFIEEFNLVNIVKV